MAGKLIVIEGLDGSGKATQAKRLVAALLEKGISARGISFPNYDSNSSALIKMYLAGDFGTEPEAVNAYAASCFYAVDRFAGMKQDWGRFYHSGGILIADRYTTSNAVHQSCKLPKEEWDEYLSWLYDFEYGKLELPIPDLVIYLRMSVDENLMLMNERYQGDETKKDIHESNKNYLKSAHDAADYCAQKYSWSIINCMRNGKMRGIADIGAEILCLIETLQ